MAQIYDFKLARPDGSELNLADNKGKVMLIVNTATGCGFTPQYEPLEALYKELHESGLEIIDIPCNQFGGQAPGSDDEIHEFCTLNYNTTFPQLKKSDVNGESVTVNASGEKAVRKTYDALMRLVKRDVWKIASTAKESVRESSETFYYNADRTYPASSAAESEGRRSETLYDDEGRAISFTEFFVDKDGTRIPDMKMVRRYTDGNKILEEEKSRWEYADEKKTRLSAIRVQKKIYDYAAGGENPNYYFYEDGKLRIKTIYAQNDAYVTTLYFDDGYTVISEYAAGEKIRETIKHGDRVLRTKKYDSKN